MRGCVCRDATAKINGSNSRSFRAVLPQSGLSAFASAHSVFTVVGASVTLEGSIAGWKTVAGIAIIVAMVAGLVGLLMLAVGSVRRRRKEPAAIVARRRSAPDGAPRG